MRPMHYKLNGKRITPCKTFDEYIKWVASADHEEARRVGWYLDCNSGVRVSTVFLGMDHRWGEGAPLLFETMVFGGKYDQEQERYSTYEEAETGHRIMCEKVQASLGQSV